MLRMSDREYEQLMRRRRAQGERDLFSDEPPAGLAKPGRRNRRSGRGVGREDAATVFGQQWIDEGLPPFIREYHFALKDNPPRRWRIDYAAPQDPWRLGVEIEGLAMRTLYERREVQGTHGSCYEYKPVLVVSGRHATISGFKEDAIKYATAQKLGLHILRFEQSQVLRTREAITLVRSFFVARGWQPR